MSDLWPAPHIAAPVDLRVELPGSKSLTNRALIVAALADAPSTIKRALRSRDTLLMAQALTSLGAIVDTDGPDWAVTPLSAEVGLQSTIDCGLAGTVMRFVPPVAGLVHGVSAFDGDPHMRNRPVGVILSALRDLGMLIDDDGRGTLPFVVHGQGEVPGGRVVVDASQSSQFVSALLLAGARYRDGVEVVHEGDPVPSQPHIEMTLEMLRTHGVQVDASQPDRWHVSPGVIRAHDETIEPDLSNAAPFVALAAITGGTVWVAGWPETTTQAGDQLRTILTAMGCTVAFEDGGLRVTGPESLRGVDLDLHDVGELTPAVAALCALADSPSRLRGVAHIRLHETDRLAALATELSNLGADVTELEDGLDIRPARLHGGVFRTYADHRMAHAGVIIGAAVPQVQVENIATTSKTFPDFAPFWEALLAETGAQGAR